MKTGLENQNHSQLDTISKKIKKEKKPLQFQVLKQCNKARASILTLPHSQVQTPIYMPVGTKGTIKGLTSLEMENLNCKILLGNTYHLGFQPGEKFLQQVGGLHKFMNWKNNILTDSGGFQMVSLSKLCTLNEEGVTFESPVDHSLMKLRPEDSMKIQNAIGGDIMMALDDVIKTTNDGPRMEEAMHRTIRWIDRCIEAHDRKEEQNLFPIIQGGLNFEWRKKCLEALISKDQNGYAIGGLSGGEAKEDFWKIVSYCTDFLPNNKPRYLMGVGYPIDLMVCACLGVDMFDCVFPTRTARFGVAMTKNGMLRLTQHERKTEFIPIDDTCTCQACKTYTRAFLYTIVTKQEVACHEISKHNIHFLLNLMKEFRQSILDEKLDQFINNFLEQWFINEKEIPQWVIDAFISVKIKGYTYNFQNNPENIKQ